MGYKTLQACIADLEKHGHLLRIREEVDPHLEIAAIHLRVHEAGGPALLFERVKGTRFPAVSNLFGTLERSRFIFRDTYETIQQLITLRKDPLQAIRHPRRFGKAALLGLIALPMRSGASFATCRVSDLPLIKHWPNDGGAFVTLPAVYTEDADRPGIMHSNLGMYRVQLNGNEYAPDEEIGLHYQLHRGIGVHQSKSNARGEPLKVSIFVGGPPAHIFSAVMPLPEGVPELLFAGALNNRRFRYFYDKEGYCVSSDADFVITGEVHPLENKPEGPFGDHLGYYSLTHPFPVMRVKNVYYRKNAVWPFTVVGRPPQEDTAFGALIHDMTGFALRDELPGVHEVHAVDAAGVHPLLLAIGSERYTPYLGENSRPSELLTLANRILGTGQLSLAKWLFIAAKEDNPALNTKDEVAFFAHILQRIDLSHDLHFYTNTSIDTLDYSGDGLNTGSKVVLAATGPVKRELGREIPGALRLPDGFRDPQVVMPGVLALTASVFVDYASAQKELNPLTSGIPPQLSESFPLLVLCDDSRFVAQNLHNWLWVTFTRSNPSHDIYGVEAFVQNKHWGCHGPLVIDARIKPHHAPPLEKDPAVERRVDEMAKPGGVLHGII